MKKIRFLASCLFAAVAFGEPQTSVEIKGARLRNIAGVSLNSDGQISIVTGSTSVNFDSKDVPVDFLASWGLDESAANAQRAAEAKAKADSKEAAEAQKLKAQAEQERKATSEREAFKQLNTRTFVVNRIIEDGILANRIIWVPQHRTVSDSLASVGGGGGSVRYSRTIQTKSDKVIVILGYPKEGLAEGQSIRGIFISDGTHTYRDSAGESRVVEKFKYVPSDETDH